MKILIITHYYKHKNAMASLRPIKLAKYFAANGHEVTVLTSLQKDNWCKQELAPIPSDNIREIYAAEHRGMIYLRKLYVLMTQRGQAKAKEATKKSIVSNESKVQNSKNTRTQRLKSFLSWLYYYSCDRFENWCLFKGLVNATLDYDLKDFDFVIATYPGAGVHNAGVWIKKHKRAGKFVADYRDPAYNPGGRTSKIEMRHDKKVQDTAVYAADAIVCVSKGMADSLIEHYRDKHISPVYVVRNGFDPADIDSMVDSHIDSRYFNFVYTGALYNGRRTVDMLAKVLRELVDEKAINIDQIKMHYAGSDFGELQNQLLPYGLDKIAVDHGYVTRQESLAMQCDSDVVLLLNWNQDNYTGVIPGKIYEYMSSKKTICALIMGNKCGSETANMIRQDNLGCACEQSAPDDLMRLKEFMRLMFEDFNKGIRRSLACEATNKYNYEHISQQYLKILNQHYNAHI